MSNVGEIRRLHDFNEVVDELEKVRLRSQRSWHEKKLVILQDNGDTESCLKCKTAGCCYQTVYATMIEALPLARRLRREGRSTIEFRTQLRKLGEEMEGVNGDDWFDQVIPCSFLSDQKLCTIYEHRPVACYGYTVTSPSDWCSPPITGKVITSLGGHGEWAETSWKNQIVFQHRFGISLECLQFGTLQRLVAIVLEGMTKPWNEFITYISSHEYPKKMPGTTGIYDLPGWARGYSNPFALRRKGKANGEGDLPSEGSSGDGQQGAGSKDSD